MPRKSVDRYLWMVTIYKAGLDYNLVYSLNIKPFRLLNLINFAIMLK